MNKVLLIGNVAREPDLRATNNGTNVCTFSLAVSRNYSSQNGERVTDFFNIVAWRNLGENCAKYLNKGSKAAVIGELQSRSYEKDGKRQYVTEIIAETVEFLTPKAQSDGFSETDEALPWEE